MPSRRILPYKNVIVNLYKHVGNSPFYTSDVVDIFPPQRICMLTNRKFLEPTGNTKPSPTHGRNYNEWQFTEKGITFVSTYITNTYNNII